MAHTKGKGLDDGVAPGSLRRVVHVAGAVVLLLATLVVGPGNYGFLDFVKVGLPLLVLTWATTLLVTPIFFPF